MARFEPSPDLDPAVAQAIQDAMDALRSELLAERTPEAPAESTRADARVAPAEGSRLDRLEEALTAIDAADDQAGLLAELLRQAGRFAERSVFLVLDSDRFTGWAAYGFDGDRDGVTHATVDAGAGAWGEVAGGAPAIELDDEACGALLSQLEGESAADGLLVAFALRGRTAGAIYADRVAKDGTLDQPALRILAYVGAQALETLPLRHGSAAGAATAEVGVADEPVVEEEPATLTDLDEVSVDLDEELLEADADVEERIREVPADEEEPEDILEVRQESPGEADEPADVFETVLQKPEVDFETLLREPEADFETAVPEVDTGFETAVPEPTEEVEDEPEEGVEGADQVADDEPASLETVEVSTLDSIAEEPAEEPELPQPPQRQLEPTEVAPPTDLDGPGWAFGGSTAITDDTRHEEARRLARLLVTEIKLYNEEKVRDGRENNNLTDQLRDDLERSRRIYEERIDEEIRRETDYFQEECVRILAGGDSAALGV